MLCVQFRECAAKATRGQAVAAETGIQDMYLAGLVARPAHTHNALPVHPGPVALEGGEYHAHPFADQGRVGPDREPGGVAGVPGAEHEVVGGLVEVGVPGGACRAGIWRLREDVAG